LAKFHIRLKVQGFELEVDGVRDDLPVLRQALTEQIAGLIAPATDLAGGEVPERGALGGATPGAAAATEAAKRARRKSRSTSTPGGGSAEGKEVAVDWRHDTSKHGSPLQSWKNADKAIWLLYVAASEANVSEMSNGTITATFKKHFRNAGEIRRNNLPRDLARLKVAQNGNLPLVSEDTTKNPPVWYLTDTGVAHAQKLVASALGQTS
jgi:hypothetical protein